MRDLNTLGSHSLTVMPSLIENAGDGLFALKKIAEGTKFCRYKGKLLTQRPNRPGKYTVEGPAGMFLRGDRTSSYGPYANDRMIDHLANAKIVWEGSQAYLCATQDIFPGEEVYVSYGDDYWRMHCEHLPPENQDASAAMCETRRRIGPLPPQPPVTVIDLSGHDSDDSSRAPTETDGRSRDASDSDNNSDEESETDLPDNDVLSEDSTHSDTTSSDLPTPDREEWFARASAPSILSWINGHFSELEVSSREVNVMLNQAYDLGSSVFGEADARRWADGFTIPSHAVDEDDDMWRACDGVFEEMIKRKRAAIDENRISAERVEGCLSVSNPFRAAVLDIATNGIDLCTPPEYEGCGWENKPALGSTFLKTAAAVEKMMFSSYWEEGLAILLTGKRVQDMPTMGLCIASWAQKLAKECGRPITNGSGRRNMLLRFIINGLPTKAIATGKYGPIQLPTIGDVARLITEESKRRGVPEGRLSVWKFDIAAAYPKLSYALEAVPHVGVELRDGVFMFFLGGVFGLTSMPFAFNVITQAIVWELNSRVINGRMLQYVDDGFVVSLDTEEKDDCDRTIALLEELLGPGAVAMHKLESGPTLDFIGYQVCMVRRMITISSRNVMKSIYAFGQVNLEEGAMIPVPTMQRLASLGSRYGKICRIMRPFVRVLYSSYRGRRQKCHVQLSPGCRAVIRTLRNLFTIIGIRPDTFSRSLSSFSRRPVQWVCEFDASLSGIGIIWFQVSPEETETAVAYSSVDITSLGFGKEAAYQNTAEYMASLLCARGVVMLGGKGSSVLLRGDSVSALTWAMKGSVRSDRAIRAAALWAQYVVLGELDIVGTQHLSAAYNSRTDLLSREGSWEDVMEDDERNYDGTLRADTPFLNLQPEALLHFVNPQRSIDSEEEFNTFFQESLSFINS